MELADTIITFMVNKNNPKIFIDTSAFKALVDFNDEFHKTASDFWLTAKEKSLKFITSNFVLDETFTLIRAQMGKQAALQLRKDLFESSEVIEIIQITLTDEQQAWNFFEKLPGRGVSFTDCTSFALMKRLRLKKAFTFDTDFKKAGFEIVP